MDKELRTFDFHDARIRSFLIGPGAEARIEFSWITVFFDRPRDVHEVYAYETELIFSDVSHFNCDTDWRSDQYVITAHIGDRELDEEAGRLIIAGLDLTAPLRTCLSFGEIGIKAQAVQLRLLRELKLTESWEGD